MDGRDGGSQQAIALPLRQRARTDYGTIDVGKALHLMSRPVPMTSNLHNVLFVPEDLVFYADGRHIAAERPYVKLDLTALLEALP